MCEWVVCKEESPNKEFKGGGMQGHLNHLISASLFLCLPIRQFLSTFLTTAHMLFWKAEHHKCLQIQIYYSWNTFLKNPEHRLQTPHGVTLGPPIIPYCSHSTAVIISSTHQQQNQKSHELKSQPLSQTGDWRVPCWGCTSFKSPDQWHRLGTKYSPDVLLHRYHFMQTVFKVMDGSCILTKLLSPMLQPVALDLEDKLLWIKYAKHFLTV